MVGLLDVVEVCKGTTRKVDIERIQLLCCNTVIWKRTVQPIKDEIKSMGWDLYHNSGVCVVCGKSKGHRLRTKMDESNES